MNPYEALGLKPGSVSPEAVERAFKSAARKAHPDKGGSNERMADVSQARDILLNPERKRRFDELGSTDSGQLSQQEQAMLILGNLFQSAVNQAPEGMPHAEILGFIALEVKKGRQKALEAKRTLPQHLKRARGLLKAIQCDELLRKAFEARLAKLELEGAEVNQQIEIGNLMMRLMQSVRFK